MATHAVGSKTQSRAFYAVLLTQALTAFTQNALRSALLALATFRGLTAFGWSTETIIGVATILVTAPFALFSVAAGRVADLVPKHRLIGAVKAAEVFTYAIAGVGLVSMSVPMLFAALLLTGLLTTLLGPAKFGILPEIVERPALMRANAWMSASNTVAILLGLVFGSLLLDSLPLLAVVLTGLALVGWLVSRSIAASLGPAIKVSGSFLEDHLLVWARVRRLSGVAAPMLGCSWFWFQGALNTTLFPLFLKGLTERPAEALGLLFVVTTIGVALGALGARQLRPGTSHWPLVAVTFALIAGPATDLGLATPLQGEVGLLRLAIDLFLMSIGTGFYLVPLTTALQLLTPATERARFIGINHALNGAAMMLAGVAMLVLGATDLPPIEAFVVVGLLTASIAAATLSMTLRSTAGLAET